MAKPTYPTYLYVKPFYTILFETERPFYIKDYLDTDDRLDEEKFRGLLLKFAVAENLVTIKDDRLLPSTTDNMGSWEWAMNWMNFRSLVDSVVYHKFIRTINANNSYAVTKIINLHAQLGMLFDEKLLNTLCNRVLQSIALIPYDTSKSPETISWEKIHKETPFIWLLIYLQTVMYASQ